MKGDVHFGLSWINARESIIVEFKFISLQLNAFRRFNEVSNLVKALFSL
jgi:hypothetical protein